MHLLQCLCIVLTLLGYSAAIDINAPIDVDRLRSSFAKHVSSRLETENVFGRVLAETDGLGYGLSQRRRLAQLDFNVCFWNDDDRACAMGTRAILDFLNRADNEVAEYLLRLIECILQRDADSCEDRACSWLHEAGVCSNSHDEFRELHSARCLRNVDHIIDIRAGNIECRSKATELSCGTERCTWVTDSCGFDSWKYFHGIQSDGSFPEGFFDVLNIRSEQLTDDIRTAIGNGDIEEFSDLLNWTPPPFDCPDDVEQVICDYVEAFLPFLIARLYCPLEYDEVFEIPDCDRDPICVAGTSDDSFCESNDVPILLSIQQGAIVFANSIEDPESRAYMLQRAQCTAINAHDDCDDEKNCVWLDENESCSVTDKWLSDEIARLVKNTNDPACGYFALDSIIGCVDEDDPETCGEDPMCSYSESSESCRVGLFGQIRYALNVSGLLDEYVSTEEACEEAENESECLAVRPPDDPPPRSEPSPEPSEEAPSSEVAMGSLPETDLDELVSVYDDAETAEEEPGSGPRRANRTSPGSSPSTGTSSLFAGLFGN